MELRVLRYFLAVAREQNITAAAETLHVTHLVEAADGAGEGAGQNAVHTGQQEDNADGGRDVPAQAGSGNNRIGRQD